MKSQLCFEPSNRNIIITIRQNICAYSRKDPKFLHFRFATPVVDIITIPIKLPKNAAGISIGVEENDDKFDPLDIQLNIDENEA